MNNSIKSYEFGKKETEYIFARIYKMSVVKFSVVLLSSVVC